MPSGAVAITDIITTTVRTRRTSFSNVTQTRAKKTASCFRVASKVRSQDKRLRNQIESIVFRAESTTQSQPEYEDFSHSHSPSAQAIADAKGHIVAVDIIADKHLIKAKEASNQPASNYIENCDSTDKKAR